MFRPFALLAAVFASIAVVAAPAQAQNQDPARPAITGIAFMRVYASDAAAAQHFYGDTLGYQRIESHGQWLFPVNRSQWLEVLPPSSGQLPTNPNDHMAAIAFTTRNAAGLAKYIAAHGVPLAQPLHDGQFAVRDPEGNLVIFVQAGSEKLVAAAPPSPHATSGRIIHVGFIVRDREKEDAFWRQLLGFRPYWFGGGKSDTVVDYVSLQVPDGSDWLEYMLNQSPDSNLHTHGIMNHFSLGVATMDSALKALAANQCQGPACTKTQMGRDGKVQLNLYDPDQTRVEFMEFKPSGPICCSPFTGQHPTETEDK
jgi:catechol 2,3-dioxygenase-like lactoylglutathione lyase family enzyme